MLPRFIEMEKEDERVMGDKAQGSSKLHRFTEALRQKVNNFCICNSEEMMKWIDMYERAKNERKESRRIFRINNPGRANPEELQELPKIMTLQWLEDVMIADKWNGGNISDEEWEFLKGCDLQVHKNVI